MNEEPENSHDDQNEADTIKSLVNDQFSQVAENYLASKVHARGVDLQPMLEAANVTGSERVLDLGVGAGHVSMLFAPEVNELIGVDLAESMLNICRKSATQAGFQNTSFKQGDVEALDFKDASFDLALSRYSAHHWPDPEKGLAEIYRVLKPGGAFLLGDIVGPKDPASDTFLQTIELLRDRSHVRDHTIDQWATMMTDAGFQVEVVFEWGCEINFDAWVKRMQTPQNKIDMLQTIMAECPARIRDELGLKKDCSFTAPGALFRGTRK